MKTTKDERKWLSFNWRPEGSTFRQWVAGSDKAHTLIPSLIDDVEEATRLLRETVEAFDNCACGDERDCPGDVALPIARAFLKEPSG